MGSDGIQPEEPCSLDLDLDLVLDLIGPQGLASFPGRQSLEAKSPIWMHAAQSYDICGEAARPQFSILSFPPEAVPLDLDLGLHRNSGSAAIASLLPLRGMWLRR